jgi:L-iditol 2-dehydrogenase
MTIDRGVYSEILRREITMLGTWNSSYNDRINDWKAVVEVMAAGEMMLEPLITHRFPLARCNEALEMMRDKKEFFTKVTFVAD